MDSIQFRVSMLISNKIGSISSLALKSFSGIFWFLYLRVINSYLTASSLYPTQVIAVSIESKNYLNSRTTRRGNAYSSLFFIELKIYLTIFRWNSGISFCKYILSIRYTVSLFWISPRGIRVGWFENYRADVASFVCPVLYFSSFSTCSYELFSLGWWGFV